MPKRGPIPLLSRGYRESLAERKGLGIDSHVMKTAPLVVAVVTATILPAVLSSFGCNKKEDATPPIPSATAVVAPPPTTAAPAATPIAPVQPTATVAVGAKPAAPHGDAAAGAHSVAHADAAGVPPPVVALPPGMQTVALPHPSALPGMAASAASALGGMIQNLPPPILPQPNPTK